MARKCLKMYKKKEGYWHIRVKESTKSSLDDLKKRFESEYGIIIKSYDKAIKILLHEK